MKNKYTYYEVPGGKALKPKIARKWNGPRGRGRLARLVWDWMRRYS